MHLRLRSELLERLRLRLGHPNLGLILPSPKHRDLGIVGRLSLQDSHFNRTLCSLMTKLLTWAQSCLLLLPQILLALLGRHLLCMLKLCRIKDLGLRCKRNVLALTDVLMVWRTVVVLYLLRSDWRPFSLRSFRFHVHFIFKK